MKLPDITRLAWRNLGRNRRRTLITIAAIAFGLAMMILMTILQEGVYRQMIASGVRNQAGHIVVQAVGWQADRKPEQVVHQAAEVGRTLEALSPDARVLSRYFVQGLLTSPASAAGVQLAGVTPAAEAAVGDLDDKLTDGEYLADDDTRGIVIGTTLAEVLDVGLGDKVVLMTQRGGDIQSQLFRVRGLFRTGMAELDGFYGHIHLTAAQEVMGLSDAVSQVSIHLPDVEAVRRLTPEVVRALAGREDVEVLDWRQALPELHQYVVVDRAGAYVFLLIMAFMVGVGVLNTILMSVFERVHEFGVLLSVGVTPRQLGALVVAEGAILGLLAVALGTGLGLAMGYPMVVNGLDYGAFAGGETLETAGVALDMLIYGYIDWPRIAVIALLCFLLSILAAIYPTLKAARLEPVEAMRHR